MPDPAEPLQRIYLAGFEFQTFDRFPKCVGVVRDDGIALLVPSPDGLQMMGHAWGGEWGKPLECWSRRRGAQVFQAKQEVLEATAERLEVLWRFRDDLQKAMGL